MGNRPGRNDPCPCGSGKKYKKCCLSDDGTNNVISFGQYKIRETEETALKLLMKYATEKFGVEEVSIAWSVFINFDDDHYEDFVTLERETTFPRWFLFNWLPSLGNNEIPLPIGLLYLEENKGNVDSYVARFIEAACNSPYSFYLITDVEPGKSLTLRNLLLDSEKERVVLEKVAAIKDAKDLILLTRIVEMDGTAIMVGAAPVSTPRSFKSQFERIGREIQLEIDSMSEEDLFAFEGYLFQLYWEMLKASGLKDDGIFEEDELEENPEFSIMNYTMTCSIEKAAKTLKKLAVNVSEEDLNSFEVRDQQGKLIVIDIPWFPSPDEETNVPWHAEISISEGFISVLVNGDSSFDWVQNEFESIMGEDANFHSIEITTLKEILEKQGDIEDLDDFEDGKTPLFDDAETLKEIEKVAQRHWKSWLDEKLPALGGMSPRQAARDKNMRDDLERLLKEIEVVDETDKIGPFAPNIPLLKKELGID